MYSPKPSSAALFAAPSTFDNTSTRELRAPLVEACFGVTGLAFNSKGELFASVYARQDREGKPKIVPWMLIQIDPATGGLVKRVGRIQDRRGKPVKIGDLATQPGTDVLFGLSSVTPHRPSTPGSNPTAQLYRIDASTARAELVGDIGLSFGGAIAFSPEGTLYYASFQGPISLVKARVPVLMTLDPADARVIAKLPLKDRDPQRQHRLVVRGMAVRPTDGKIFACTGYAAAEKRPPQELMDNFLATIDPGTGTLTSLASSVEHTRERIGDIAFEPVDVARPSETPLTDAGWTALFNGRDLSGWHGALQHWKVQDGALIGEVRGSMPRHSYLVADGEYSDFELRLRYKLDNVGDSGVQFRSQEGANGRLIGYQADIGYLVYQADERKDITGDLYEEGVRGWIAKTTPQVRRRLENSIPKDRWNDLRITAVGDHLTIEVNGVKTVDLNDRPGRKSGVVALKLHAGRTKPRIAFKDIRILTLDPSRGSTSETGAAGRSVAEPSRVELLEVQKIWDQAPHNAFTDLARFQDRWYCVFREGIERASPDGAIRVLVSDDGTQWKSAARITSGSAICAIRRSLPLLIDG